MLFLFCCVVLTAFVLGPEILGNGKSKDYALWFWAGQQVLHGGDLYPSDPHDYFSFLYPPLPAVLLAVPSWFGKVVLYTCLSLLNCVAWWMTGQFSNAMTGSGKRPGPLLFALPGVLTITSVFDMFDLGQPNLVLLALMLFGFWLLQQEKPWIAGSMFALAAAIKVFPAAVLPYLVWRRQWATVASMAICLCVFLFVVPAPVRGFQHNIVELKTWYRGMVGSSSERGFGQRDAQNWSWVNQSIVAMTHRFTRPINYNQEDPAKPVRTMNIVDISYEAANRIVLAVYAAFGIGFIAIMPRASRRTRRSDAEEIGILFCLMTLATPLARQYYFISLFFPMTVVIHRAAFDPRPKARFWSWAALVTTVLLMCLSFRIFPYELQAYGNNFLATLVLAGCLVWHILHPPKEEAAGSTAPAELKGKA